MIPSAIGDAESFYLLIRTKSQEALRKIFAYKINTKKYSDLQGFQNLEGLLGTVFLLPSKPLLRLNTYVFYKISKILLLMIGRPDLSGLGGSFFLLAVIKRHLYN